MGLLENLKPADIDSDFVKLKEPHAGNDPEKNTFANYQVDVPNSVQRQAFDQVQEVPRMANEGTASGHSAADSLFNNNTSTFSRALSSRAQKSMASSRFNRDVMSQVDNVKRQQLQANQVLNTQNDLYKIKRQNFAGQLKFSAEVSNYYNTLSAMKVSALSSLFGNVFKMGGKLAGGGM